MPHDRAHGAPGADDNRIQPGLGVTAQAVLARAPQSYVGIERDAGAATLAESNISRAGHSDARIVRGDAARVPLDDGTATVVLGEAVLGMHSHEKKHLVMAEAFRLLRPGGRYAIHELAVVPDDIAKERLARIQKDLSASIHVGVRIGTEREWCQWLESAGFEIEATRAAPMRLLELGRLIADEGITGTARVIINSTRTPGALRRLHNVRGVFREHQAHLGAIALIARRPR